MELLQSVVSLHELRAVVGGTVGGGGFAGGCLVFRRNVRPYGGQWGFILVKAALVELGAGDSGSPVKAAVAVGLIDAVLLTVDKIHGMLFPFSGTG